jgi:hypothetical protein
MNNAPQTITGWDNEKRPVQPGYPPYLVQDFCVRDAGWQKFRLSLKGLPTHEKLARLIQWWDDKRNLAEKWQGKHIEKVAIITETEVQVGNYLGALRRGGQLDANNRIKKYI